MDGRREDPGTGRPHCPDTDAWTTTGHAVRLALDCRSKPRAGLRILRRPAHGALSRRGVYRPRRGFVGIDRVVVEHVRRIHPNVDGFAQYAATLANVVTAGHLIPPLP